ncbi:hypothetical protein B0A55_13254 [Friedmanniomyces simplex]|uniref:FAD-binding PCMH-type domain-containing protein n=1 Tax=Friedmanniomyces simplex TaxID=329884 RepID=A0A4U0VNP3_9PEZI|nr:hypothetical protein B0A55_13254 [Friedmanniomyces simplex]
MFDSLVSTADAHPESPFRLIKPQNNRPVVLPPNTTEPAFQAALEDLRGEIGAEWVKVNDIDLVDGDYHAVPLSHDSYHILEQDDLVPSAVCWPENTEGVSRVVKWANKHSVPIWPISIGRNLGYGGSAPRVRGSVIVDLGRRMNRVLDVSEKNATCLIEPGVQYLSLYEHLQKTGLGDRLWIDVPDLPGGSVMGNALDRGVGYTPHGGIRPFMATFPKEEDLATAVDALRPLMLQKVIGNVPCLRLGLQDATMYHKKTEFPLRERGLVDRKKSQKIIDNLGTGAWVFYAALYGPDEITQPKFDLIKKSLSVVPGAKFYERKDVSPESYLHDYAKFTAGIPTWRELDRMEYIPNASHLFFAPISAIDGEDAVRQAKMCRERMEEYGFDYLGTFFIGHREMHHVISFMYDKTDLDMKRRALACIRALIDDAAMIGVGEYRTHLALQDQVAGTYNWNDNAVMRLNEKLKDAMDPNGILQPGRSGIWPKVYRGQGWELRGEEKVSDPKKREMDVL